MPKQNTTKTFGGHETKAPCNTF